MILARPFSYVVVIGLIGTCTASVRAQEVAAGRFVRGDADADGQRNISDAVYMLGCSFLAWRVFVPADKRDAAAQA